MVLGLPPLEQPVHVATNATARTPNAVPQRLRLIGNVSKNMHASATLKLPSLQLSPRGRSLGINIVICEAVVLMVACVLPLPGPTEAWLKLQLLRLPAGEMEHEAGENATVPL